MDRYMVTRPFSGHKAGDVLTSENFVSPHRAAQLIDQRYLSPLSSGGFQPTSQTLLGATVRQLRDLVGSVQDAGVIEAALAQEPRQVAIETLTKRLEELNA